MLSNKTGRELSGYAVEVTFDSAVVQIDADTKGRVLGKDGQGIGNVRLVDRRGIEKTVVTLISVITDLPTCRQIKAIRSAFPPGNINSLKARRSGSFRRKQSSLTLLPITKGFS